MNLDDFFEDKNTSVNLIRAITEASKSKSFEKIISDIENGKWNLSEKAFKMIQKYTNDDVKEEFYNMLAANRVLDFKKPVKEKIQVGNTKVWKIDWADDNNSLPKLIFAKSKQEAFYKFHERFGDVSNIDLDGIRQIDWKELPVRSNYE